MNKKSRRLSRLITILNDLIDIYETEIKSFNTIDENKTFKKIEVLLKVINFELSYLQLKNYGTK